MDIAKIRPVIVGSGYIASQHVCALAELGIRPVAVWSPNFEHASAAAARWGCVVAADLAEELDWFDATHVHVCATPMQHEEIALEAAERGHVLVCEKPLAPTLASAQKMVEAVRRRDVSAYLTFNRRMDSGVQLLRDAIGSGTIGQPVTVFGSYRQQWNTSPSSRDWRFDPAQVGPSRVITEIDSHWLDLAEFVLGRPLRAVHAFVTTMGERSFDTGSERGQFTPVNEDVFSAQLRFEDGVVGHVYGTELAHGMFDDIELQIDGTLRSAVWSSRSPNQLAIAHKQEGIRIYGQSSPTTSISACIAAIYGGKATALGVATFTEGARNAAAMDAIRASAASGEWRELAS
jgi:predicted dehydrogenase